MLAIDVGGATFEARLEEGVAPGTVAAFRRLLPLESKLIHARWSGEACWIPFGERDELLAADPDTYYVKPHYERAAVVLVRLSRVTREALEDLVRGAHRIVSRMPPARGRARKPAARRPRSLGRGSTRRP